MFYVCPRKQHGKELLSEDDIRMLSERHTIGAHTLRHVHLPDVSQVEARQEIEGSKSWVEQITGKECTSFCYPYGDYSSSVAALVKEAGFKDARTTKQLQFESDDPFMQPTTLQIAPFPRRKTWSRWWHPLDPFGPLRVKYRRLRKLGIRVRCLRSWSDLAICLFDRAKETNKEVFHLWGHSHEIEKYGMWGELETFLKHTKNPTDRTV